MFDECRLAVRQPELGYKVGAKPNSEKLVTLKLTKGSVAGLKGASQGGDGAMGEWIQQYVSTPIWMGRYYVQWNSVNAEYNYNVGNPPSEPAAKQWMYLAKSVECHIGYYVNWTGTPASNNNPTNEFEVALKLRDCQITNRGLHPVAGRFASGSGFVNIGSPILHQGPFEWELI